MKFSLSRWCVCVCVVLLLLLCYWGENQKYSPCLSIAISNWYLTSHRIQGNTAHSICTNRTLTIDWLTSPLHVSHFTPHIFLCCCCHRRSILLYHMYYKQLSVADVNLTFYRLTFSSSIWVWAFIAVLSAICRDSHTFAFFSFVFSLRTSNCLHAEIVILPCLLIFSYLGAKKTILMSGFTLGVVWTNFRIRCNSESACEVLKRQWIEWMPVSVVQLLSSSPLDYT